MPFVFQSWSGYEKPNNSGIKEQLCRQSYQDEREVVLGIDFGTAYTKVVIGDRALGKAFVVRFSSHQDVQAYILPSRVYLDNQEYKLDGPGTLKTNLKLNLINSEINTENFYSAIAFLALVIRHARGWLFSSHKDLYKNVNILWKVTLGLPFANYTSEEVIKKFDKAIRIAWFIARKNRIKINEDMVINTCNDNKNLLVSRDIEFDVIPELSAQIYGFIQSTKFDPSARNIFLMVDIGAGTVDSSIFKVEEKKGIWEFKCYSNIVEYHGVMNLHNERMNFINRKGRQLPYFAEIDSSLNGIPESWEEYSPGIARILRKGEQTPDDIFYKKFRNQITDTTLKDALQFFGHDVFRDTPLFLCGGGSRMKFFQKLASDLKTHQNASWFRFHSQQLEVPGILDVENFVSNDIDRFSVAFGLSFLDTGEYIRARLKELPSRPQPSNPRACPGCGGIGTCYCK